MKIRFLREAGGLGDVVRCLGTVRSVREAIPDAECWFYTVGVYTQLARLCPDVHRTIDVPWTPDGDRTKRKPHEARQRYHTPDPRKHTYLAKHGRFDATIDMYDTAFTHETETRGKVYLDRISLWTAHAACTLGVDLRPRLARLHTSARVLGWAEGWLEAVSLHSREHNRAVVLIQPISVDPRRSFTAAQVMRIVKRLDDADIGSMFIHVRRRAARSHEKSVLNWIAHEHRPLLVARDLERVVAMVASCDVIVSGDSGIMHIAAALGRPSVCVYAITRGDIITQHYPHTIAIDAGPRERAGCWCSERYACYGFNIKRHGVWLLPCMSACLAMQRIDPDRIAEEVLRCV